MKPSLIRLGTSVLLLSTYFAITAQVSVYQYTVSDGLPSNHLTDLDVDSLGRIYVLCNQREILTYDGRKFQPIDTGIFANQAYKTLEVLDKNRLALLSENGVSVYQTGRPLQTYPVENARELLRIQQDLFVLGDLSVFAIRNARKIDLAIPGKPKWITHLNGEIYCGTDNRFYRLVGNRFQFVSDLPFQNEDARVITIGKELFCINEHQVWEYDGVEWSFVGKLSFSSSIIQAIEPSTYGFFILSVDGLFHYDPFADFEQVIGNQSGVNFKFDRWNNLWIAHPTMGLFKRTSKWITQTPISTIVLSLQQLDHDTLMVYGADYDMQWNSQTGILESPYPYQRIFFAHNRSFVENDGLWLQKEDSTVPLLLDGQQLLTIREYGEDFALLFQGVLAIAVLDHDSLIIKKQWHLGAAYDQLEIHRDRIWLHGTNDLGLILDDNLIEIKLPVEVQRINGITPLDEHSIQLACPQGIVTIRYYDGDQHIEFNELINYEVFAVRRFAQQIYATTARGMECFDLGITRRTVSIGRDYGLQSTNFTPGVLVVTNTQVIAAVQNVIYSMSMDDFSSPSSPPGVDVKLKRIDNQSYKAMGLPHNLRSDQRNFSIEIEIIDHLAPNQVVYQWRFDDGFWSEFIQPGELHFAEVGSGKHQLEVRAFRESAPTVYDAIQWRFSIAPFWYERQSIPWFLGMAGILLAFGIYRIRIRQIRRKHQANAFRLQMNHKVLKLEQQAVQLQMNPHFIFNCLSMVKAKVVEGNLTDSEQYLNRFSTLLRSLLNHSREESVQLNDELQLLQDYIHLHQGLHPNRIYYSIDLDPNIDPFLEEIPPMMIQPIIENSIKYGLSNQKINITLIFRLDNGNIIVVIQDDGPGIFMTQQTSNNQHASKGLTVIKERLNILNQSEDGLLLEQVEEDGKIGGTKITLKIPRM